MKHIVILFIVLLSGCTSGPKYLYNDLDLSADQRVLLTNQCDAECENKIKSALELDNKYVAAESRLLEVNGIKGGYNRNISVGKMFNSTLDGSLEIYTVQGLHELLAHHALRTSHSFPERFKVNLLAGHTYHIGGFVVKQGEENTLYRWFPVVYDLTDNKVVYAGDSAFQVRMNLLCRSGHPQYGPFCKCMVGEINSKMSFKEKEDYILGLKAGENQINEKLLKRLTAGIVQCLPK
ncbi:hypothetical protein [Pseudoalteromonas sp. Of7M-16]|uniref:hypothetical protein n=1 Tax=Pseudoalteromonas sp. Of7M-16 TaxID=2917756 RepID=UPI001EF6BE0B|nr:hypothetical protein [Pseudoalteromonas sp. Of7M-16]MCG7550552.1 hypothetical protein [Pseudoalteromonas sp. Of7M-16]